MEGSITMNEEEMYEAVISNDANYDGVFFYGVRSTGIFCRPSCPSKKPLRDNVVFFRTAKEALDAGFRPCKRCRSDLLTYMPMADIAEDVKRQLDEIYEKDAAWNDELRSVGLSQRRITDIFKEYYGMTPKAYVDGRRLSEAKRLLEETDERVIDIVGSVGFGSVSAFNRFFRAETGCSPTAWRKKARG
jgi:AraC family transcriptional regulator of adaptative response / methylphosphotriester-DNA alkyltransferase methyltransferase